MVCQATDRPRRSAPRLSRDRQREAQANLTDKQQSLPLKSGRSSPTVDGRTRTKVPRHKAVVARGAAAVVVASDHPVRIIFELAGSAVQVVRAKGGRRATLDRAPSRRDIERSTSGTKIGTPGRPVQ